MAQPPTLPGLTLLLPLLLPPWAPTRADLGPGICCPSPWPISPVPVEPEAPVPEPIPVPSPDAPLVSISCSDSIGQQGHRETSLTCDAHSNQEPKSYDWSMTMGPLPLSAVIQGSRLLIQPTEESINTTFICHVSNDLGMGQAAMRVQLPEAGKVAVLAPTEWHGSLGSAVILPCHLKPLESKTSRVTQIRWMRLDPRGDASIVAEFHWERGPSIPEPERVKFVTTRLGADLVDASLTVHGLIPGDEANYTCEIHISTSQMGSASTWLRVFYAPQVSISLYDDIGQQGHRETSLTCDACSNPKPKSYNWSTTTGPLPPFAVPQGSRLLIQPTEESINTTFICRVSNALGTGQAARRVQIPGSPWEPSPLSSALWIGLPVAIAGIMLVAVLGALVYSRGRRHARGCLWNIPQPCVGPEHPEP